MNIHAEELVSWLLTESVVAVLLVLCSLLPSSREAESGGVKHLGFLKGGEAVTVGAGSEEGNCIPLALFLLLG